MQPTDARAFLIRGHQWWWKNEYDKALADYNEAIRRDANEDEAFLNRAQIWQLKNEHDKAFADFAEAARLNPTYDGAFKGQAWIWATCPDAKYRDGRKAVDSATTACELTEWKSSVNIDVLAAAYAEVGEFEKAVEYEEKALRLTLDPSVREEREDRLALYKNKMPYRDKRGH